jgi:hypothetical protein
MKVFSIRVIQFSAEWLIAGDTETIKRFASSQNASVALPP